MKLSRGAIIIPLTLLAGCSSVQTPVFEVTDARVTERSDDAVVVVFTIDAHNTNEVELPLREADYGLWVGGQRVFHGRRSPEATLRRLGTQTFELPAVVPLDVASGAQYELKGHVVYTTPGKFAEILYDAGLVRPKAPFGDSGTLGEDSKAAE